MIPYILVLRKANLNYNKKLIISRAYTLLCIGTTNNTKRRSVPTISPKEYNEYGRHYFISLHTGKFIHSIPWEEISIDEELIQSVEKSEEREGKPLMSDVQTFFEWVSCI